MRPCYYHAVPYYEGLDMPMYEVRLLWWTGAMLARCHS